MKIITLSFGWKLFELTSQSENWETCYSAFNVVVFSQGRFICQSYFKIILKYILISIIKYMFERVTQEVAYSCHLYFTRCVFLG